jgi:hypothetical protein
MTVGGSGSAPGTVLEIIDEQSKGQDELSVMFRSRTGVVSFNLSVGANVAKSEPLDANRAVSNTGVKLHGAGFIVSRERAQDLGLGRTEGLERHIREYRNGRDINQTTRDVLVIDLDGLNSKEVMGAFPEVYQHVFETVKPERDHNNERYRRENWWLFGRRNTELRAALNGLPRFIATAETSKHRFFVFLPASVLPDNMLVNIGLADALYLGTLSSRVHVTWSLAAGGTLEDRPRYNKTRCFETFPFPAPDEMTKQRIRDLAEQLDAHRKRQQELHPDLTMTGMYNVLEKLRAGETLSAKEQKIHEQGLVSVLKQIHDDLDAAVCDAYGWPHDLTDEQILERLVALNHERAEEESRGLIRWLRPEFQNPAGTTQTQIALPAGKPTAAVTTPAKAKKQPWPKSLPARITAVRASLSEHSQPMTAADIARGFTRAKADAVEELLETLVAVGQARQTAEGKYVM